MSIRVQVVFYSMYGHVYKMAEAVAARGIPDETISLVRQRQKLSLPVSIYWKVYTARPKPDAINLRIAQGA